MNDKRCEIPLPDCDRDCGHPAVAILKMTVTKIRVFDPSGEEVDRGSASSWVPVCHLHLQQFPDYEGFSLDGAHQTY